MRRDINSGARLAPALLRAPSWCLVRRADPVMMQLQSANFVIHANDRAMGNGAADERIAVENLTSNRVVHGTVTGDGRITVEF